jgi:hypothetical protein
MTRTLLTILFALGFLASPAQAGQWKSIATWDIAYGEHSCYAIDTYKNGTVFGFGLTDQGTFNLILSNPSWKLGAGDRLALVKVDDGAWSRHTASTLDDDTLLISVVTEEKSFRVLGVGSTLKVRLGAEELGYRLSGTRLMLPELIKCAAALRAYKQT